MRDSWPAWADYANSGVGCVFVGVLCDDARLYIALLLYLLLCTIGASFSCFGRTRATGAFTSGQAPHD